MNLCMGLLNAPFGGGGGINEMKNEKNVKIPFKNTHQ